jgi:parvulin-like peptidyl-prolyl isomerase
LWFVLSEPVSALSIREILGLENGDNAVESDSSAKEKKDKTIITAENSKKAKKSQQDETKEVIETKLDFEEIQKILAVLDERQRKALLTDEQAFQKFIRQEAVNQSILSAAKANKVDKNEKAIFLTQRGAENILREFYLNQLIRSKIPKDFPTDQQIKEYYEQNKDKFVLAERVHVWQIFLQITDELSKKEIELVKKQAESISSDLNKGKISFDKAAQKYSDQESSKYNGGYLGLVKVKELKTEVQKPLMALAEGKISKPIKTDDGMHILKRGIIVPKQELELEQVHDQIKKLLKTQIRQKLRQEIFKQAGKTYPVDLDDNKIEEWRLKLRTNLQPSTVSSLE